MADKNRIAKLQMEEFTTNGTTLVFYQKPNDKKYSFLIKDNEELTQFILASVKKKRVTEEEFGRVDAKVFELIAKRPLE